jgi:diadenosine tetraphosphate (Ap4A) HIT family hydrolase
VDGARDPETATNMQQKWELHPQLAQDTVAVGDLALSRVLASKDAGYPWLIVVPRRAGVSEIIDLSAGDQAALTVELAQVAGALKQLTGCDKLNIAAIGNMVPQLHVHVVARRKGDAAWPKPVWGAAPAKDYPPGALAQFVDEVRQAMGLA